MAASDQVSWNRAATKFEELYGVRPRAGRTISSILRDIQAKDAAWGAAARNFYEAYGEMPGAGRTTAAIRVDVRKVVEPKDNDWIRVAAKFEAVYGVRPASDRTVSQVINDIGLRDPGWAKAAREFQSVYGQTPAYDRTPAQITADVRRATPTPTPDPSPSIPTPDPETTPGTPAPVDFRARAAALYPWLPDNLLNLFVDHPDFGWAKTGDPSLALAGVRASDEYKQAFPGIKRSDGSLRMSEAEWFSTREAYGRLFQEFGLNQSLFTDRFEELMEGEVSPSELAGRLGGAFELMNNIPEVQEAFEQFNGTSAVFAWFIDPDLGQAIIDKKVSIAQVAGEGLARGFDVQQGFAERLVAGGVDQGVARNLFVQAEGQLQSLDDLARRHRDPDDTFDLEEFADANVFGDAVQTRRIRRLLRQEASLFTPREVGTVQTRQDFALTGLTPR